MSSIDEVISRIQGKWGHQAVQNAYQLSRKDKVYSSGFLSLDNLIEGRKAAFRENGCRNTPLLPFEQEIWV